MPRSPAAIAIARVSERIPGLRRVPLLRLLAVAEIAMLARDHFERLEPTERRRLMVLIGRGRGRPSNLTRRERVELATLIAKAEPKLFARMAADKISPVPLSGWSSRGAQKRS